MAKKNEEGLFPWALEQWRAGKRLTDIGMYESMNEGWYVEAWGSGGLLVEHHVTDRTAKPLTFHLKTMARKYSEEKNGCVGWTWQLYEGETFETNISWAMEKVKQGYVVKRINWYGDQCIYMHKREKKYNDAEIAMVDVEGGKKIIQYDRVFNLDDIESNDWIICSNRRQFKQY